MSPNRPLRPNRLHRWLIGPEGIRTGWRVLTFAVLLYVFRKILSKLVLAIPFLAAPLRAMASGDVIPSALLILEVRNLAAAALAFAIMMKFEHRSLADYGLPFTHAFGARFWQGFALCSGAIVLLFLMLRAEGVFFFGHMDLTGRAILIYAGLWFLACVMVALFEEFVFRGYMLHTLQRGIGFWPAAVLSSALFGLSHLANSNDPWYIILSAATFGMLDCLAVLRTGTLWFAVGVHAADDFVETFLISPSGGLSVRGHLLNSSLHGPAWLTGGVPGPEAGVNGVLVFVLLFLIVNRLGGKPRTLVKLRAA
jgi:uncharacterized protein